ncbi:hypothetical protein HYS49_01565 [Candidatus Woesearchaeota archaeon]|nr:hypothetical protein [Candidatus Woesearchaeota archaeon]
MVTYCGAFSEQERWADNSEFFLQIVHEERSYGGITPEKAREELEFYKRFPPEKLHDRLVAQRISVFAVQNPQWKMQGKNGVVAQGTLDCLLTIDLGQELLRTRGKEIFQEELLAVEKEVALPDGTFIRGRHFKKNLLEEGLLALARRYCAVEFNHTPYGYKIPLYTITIGREFVSKEQPVEYGVTSYVMIDGQLIHEKKEVVRAVFKRGTGMVLPGRFERFLKTRR